MKLRLLLHRFCVASAMMLFAGVVRAAETLPRFELRSGDRVVLLGDTLIEREQAHGWIELMLTTRFADRDITFRNLGWSADTPAGDSRFGLSLLQAGREPADEGWNNLVKQIEDAKPTVVFIGYGMASSFDGAAGVAKFRSDYVRLLDVIAKTSPAARVILLSPIPHENLGAPWPDPAMHNRQLALYADVIRALATERRLAFVSLFDALQPLMARATPADRLTDNGIHLTAHGYTRAAEAIEQQLFGASGPWRATANAEQLEPLRRAILRKNEWFFHRSRPANMAYILGFRRREQGNNAVELSQFDAFIAAEEKRIAQLRALRPANVPEIPRRIGNLTQRHTPQPHPKFQVADDLEVTLWAENPLLHKPIQMNFDARGRLWVASSELYPQIEPGQAATDRIVILEDSTGSGRADKATVFADGLLIPTGVAPGDGGAYVGQSTELLHFKDTDGDGKADVRRTVLSGFGVEDTHHNLHTLRWGPDGRFYMNQSVYTRTDTETPHGVVRLKAGGIFRFDPRDQRMEILFRGWVNAWGHQFDDFGQSFVTDGAGFQGVSWGVPGATYRTLAPARRELQSVSPGSYPKFCGLEIVRSEHFPADWQGDMITADFRAHRIVRFKIAEQGSGYVTREMPDLMRTTTDSFRPIDVRLGPDGALYVADWSNPIIQHGEVDFRDPRRDKEHGRIWRIAFKGRPPLARADLTRLRPRGLLDKLASPNGYEQEQAKRLLVERGADAVLPDLMAWEREHTDEKSQLQALWVRQAFNLPLDRRLLEARDPRVRAASVRAHAAAGAATLDQLARLVGDPHPRVRLEAVRALGRHANARAAELALGVLEREMDPFLDYALWLTINELATPWVAAVQNGAWKIDGREPQLEFALKALPADAASELLGQVLRARGLPLDGSGPWIELLGSAGGAADLRPMLDSLLRGAFAEPVAVRAIRALGDAARLRNITPAGDLAPAGVLLDHRSAAVRAAAIPLIGTWKLADRVPRLVAIASDADTATAERAAAFAALRNIGGPNVVAELKSLLGGTPAPTPEIRREAVVALAALDVAAALPQVIATLRQTTDPAAAEALWRALLAVRGVGLRLANELPKAGLPAEVARAGLRPAREGAQHQPLVQTLLKLAGLTSTDRQLSAAELQQIARDALAQGNAARGELIYRRAELACVACHAIGGAGGKVGPDLTSIGASAPPDYLVEALLYPNAKIKEGYHAVSLTTRDNQSLSGMIVRENATEIVLRDAANQEVSVPVQNIARRASTGSLMPPGLIDPLLPEERLDLIKFLAQLGKPGDYDAAKGGVARAWRLYLVVSQNQHLGVERVVRGDFALADWKPALALVNGTISKDVIDATYASRNNSRGLFAATHFQSARGGRVRFALHGAVAAAWVNGVEFFQPGAELTAEVKPGLNTIVLRLDDARVGEGVKLTAADVTFVNE